MEAVGSLIGLPIWVKSIICICLIASTSSTVSLAILLAKTLYILPTWFTGFLPEVASIDMGLHGVIKPLALFPLPTEPSSPISAEVPVTVR